MRSREGGGLEPRRIAPSAVRCGFSAGRADAPHCILACCEIACQRVQALVEWGWRGEAALPAALGWRVGRAWGDGGAPPGAPLRCRRPASCRHSCVRGGVAVLYKDTFAVGCVLARMDEGGYGYAGSQLFAFLDRAGHRGRHRSHHRRVHREGFPRRNEEEIGGFPPCGFSSVKYERFRAHRAPVPGAFAYYGNGRTTEVCRASARLIRKDAHGRLSTIPRSFPGSPTPPRGRACAPAFRRCAAGPFRCAA